MSPRSATWFAALLAVGSTGCGMGVAGDDGDGGESCTVYFSKQPSQPTLGDEVQLTAQLDEGDVEGYARFNWTVLRSGRPLEIAGAEEEVIEFVADGAGIHTVEVNASMGGQTCIGTTGDFNVLAAGARSAEFALRVLPADSDVPPQYTSVELWGGASEYWVDQVVVDPGDEISGVSRDSNGVPIPAYLRHQPLNDGRQLYSESFASDDGRWSMRVGATEHELLVIPDDSSLPPYRLQSQSLEDLGLGTQVQPSDTFNVWVRSGAGNPVVGARVSLVVDGVPSSVAVTDDNGNALLHMTADRVEGSSVSATVVPLETDGLPRLEVPVSEGMTIPPGPPGYIGIAYAPSLRAREVAPAIVLAGGGPADGSRVTWISLPITDAGTITINEVSRSVDGVVHRTVLAPGGAMAPTLLPEAIYDVVVEPPDDAPREEQAASETRVDFTPGDPDPTELSLTAPARIVGRVLARGEEGPVPLAGVRVEARAISTYLEGIPSIGASDITGEDGSFTLLVPAIGEYAVIADGGPVGQGRAHVLVVSSEPGGVTEQDIELGPVLRATGVLVAGGDPVAGAHLQLLCNACGAYGATIPISETVTDEVGRFFLTAEDPGADPPDARPPAQLGAARSRPRHTIEVQSARASVPDAQPLARRVRTADRPRRAPGRPR